MYNLVQIFKLKRFANFFKVKVSWVEIGKGDWMQWIQKHLISVEI